MANATQTNEATPATEAKAPKVKTVADDMASRRVFDSTEEAGAYIVTSATTLDDFGDKTIASVGLSTD